MFIIIDDVVSRSKSEKEPQTQELYILIGTIFGVIFLAIIIFVILFLYFKRRQGLGGLFRYMLKFATYFLLFLRYAQINSAF